MVRTTRKYFMADFFSGAGGLSWGLQEAGFKPVYAFDLDQHACQTYRHNLGVHVLNRNISEVTSQEVLESSMLRPGDLALVCGGPPCQGFSVQRRGAASDPRNDLVVKFAELAVALKPSFVLMENVQAILGKRGKSALAEAYRVFSREGYVYVAQALDAADYGVPQHRQRAIVVAWRPEVVSGFSFPGATHNETNWRTVFDAIGDMPEPPDDFTEHPQYSNHVRVRASRLNEIRISHVPPGGGRTDLPPHLQLPCHQKDNGHRHLDVYGRMEWDKPAPTITAMFDSFTRGRFAHPVHNRAITGREGARIQTFPERFKFYGPKKDVARQIGNAVPPLLAQRIGEAIIASLEGKA